MARRVTGKRVLVFGRRPRGSAKAARGGPVPAKHKRKTWPQRPGAVGGRKGQVRFEEPMEGRKTYGPYGPF